MCPETCIRRMRKSLFTRQQQRTDSLVKTGVTILQEVEARCGAALMVEMPRSEGMRYIIGNLDTTELSFVDALTDAREIAYVLRLREAGIASGLPNPIEIPVSRMQS